MLGKYHISISIYTILPFIIPILFFFREEYFIHSIAALVGVYLGSLLPDADCNAKTTLYYKSKVLSRIINFIIITPINFTFNLKNQHRGLFHSPIGIIISSLILTSLVEAILWYMRQSNLTFIILFFISILIGQLLHLLEDSCTVSGIMWGFPFTRRKFKGRIYTQRKSKKIDIRPLLFKEFLFFYSVFLITLFRYNLVTYSIREIYYLISISILLIWVIIILISKGKSKIWYRKKKNLRKFKTFKKLFYP